METPTGDCQYTSIEIPANKISVLQNLVGTLRTEVSKLLDTDPDKFTILVPTQFPSHLEIRFLERKT